MRRLVALHRASRLAMRTQHGSLTPRLVRAPRTFSGQSDQLRLLRRSKPPPPHPLKEAAASQLVARRPAPR